MSVCRVLKSKDYTTMCNHHLKNKELSLKAKGLMSVVLSLPDNWDYSVSGLVAITGEGQTSIKTLLNELKEHGYLVVTKLSPKESSTGRFEYIYDFYEMPEKTRDGNLCLERLHLEKRPYINNYISSTKDIYISPYNPPKGDEPKPKKKSQKDSINYDEVLEKFKAICISLPKPLQLSDSRKRAIKKIEPLIAKFGGWEKFFEKIQSSSFLTGNKTQWKAEFDWVLKEKNTIKIIEGSYDDAKQVTNQQQETKPNLADSQQRDDTVETFLGLNSLDELENYKQEE